jgi:hypothetical protein
MNWPRLLVLTALGLSALSLTSTAAVLRGEVWSPSSFGTKADPFGFESEETIPTGAEITLTILPTL